jgi:ABC-2 type transport system permease protein
VNAFVYLVRTSARNRVRTQLQRARSPRYAIALAVGIIYVWAFLFRPAARVAPGTVLLGQPAEMIVTLLAALMLMGTWVFGSDTIALAFTQAEVSMLFPAPVTRRALIGLKLYRAQIAVLINSLIWVFVLRRGGTYLPGPLRAMGIWVLFSTMNLHRLAAALVRSSWREHGGAGAKRNAWSIAFFATVAALLAAGFVQHIALFRSAIGVGGFMRALGATLASAPASYGLLPFHLVVAPTFARSNSEWLRAIGPALLVLLAHLWWVLRTDRAFEDAAIEASAERAKRLQAMRNRRSLAATGTPKPVTSTLRLATAGHPAMAIVWKNLLCLRRTAQYRLFIGPLVMAIALGFAFGSGLGTGATIAASALVLAAMLLVFGGRLIRNDLRHDMLHLPLLKSLPLSAGDIVLAEVASAALPMAAFQLILLMVAEAASYASTVMPIPRDIRLAVLAVSPFAILSLNAALLTIQNGIAVLFPGWIRLGAAVNTGVEALGQNVLATAANLISLAIALIVPALIGVAAVAFLDAPQASTIALLIILAALVLAAETYGAMRLLGRALARAEPPSTA